MRWKGHLGSIVITAMQPFGAATSSVTASPRRLLLKEKALVLCMIAYFRRFGAGSSGNMAVMTRASLSRSSGSARSISFAPS